MTSLTGNEAVYDAIVVGSGAGGCAAAYRLASAGARVAIIEKGEELPRDGSTLDFRRVVSEGGFKSQEPWQDGRGRMLVPEEYFNVGGKTKWYGAALLRFGRQEFEADVAHECLAWPLAYEDLAPYYAEAEALLDVRCFPVEPDLRRILDRLAAVAPAWRAEPLPMGLSAAIGKNRLEAAHFDGFASVANLKRDAETVFLDDIRRRPNVTMLTGSAVVDLVGSPEDGREVVGVRLADGRSLQGSHVLLAAGALHSPRLLQRYLARTGQTTSQPGFNAVGRYLKLHLLTAVIAVSWSRKTDLLRKTAVLLNEELPHSSVQPLGFDGELMSTLIPRFVPRFLARQVGARAYGFFLQTEDGSHPANRVVGADSAPPTLDYDGARCQAADQEHAVLVRRFRWSLARAGLVAFSQRVGLAGTAHVCGTLVAGDDPAHCVVDRNGQVHGIRGLHVVDASVLPRSSRVNPSLTIYAWALHVADRLLAAIPQRGASKPGDP
jgi:choline dehydrogenase-like flavoprotein